MLEDEGILNNKQIENNIVDWNKLIGGIINEFSADVGMIHYLNKDTQFLYIIAYHGDLPETLLEAVSIVPVGQGIVGTTVVIKKPVVISDLPTDTTPFVIPGARTVNIKGMITVPIFLKAEIIGTISLGCYVKRQFTEKETNKLIEIGEKIANKLVGTVGRVQKLETTGPSPSPRNSLAIGALGTDIYVFGGTKEDFNTQTSEFYNDLYSLHTDSKTWEKLSPIGPLPSPRGIAASVGIESKKEIFVFGGLVYEKGFTNMIIYNELWSYSPSNNRWTLVQSINQPPPPRGKPTIWNVNDKIYIFGGVTNGFQMLNDLWCYDPQENSWTEIVPKNEPPLGRLEAMSGTTPSTQGFLTIYGGEGSDPESQHGINFRMLNDVWQYDLKNNLWKEVTPDPNNNIPVFSGANVGVIDDYLYLVGGDWKGGPGEASGFGAPFPQNVCNDIWRFDLKKHIWKQIKAGGDISPRVKQAGTVVLNNKLFIICGFDFINKDGKGPGQLWNQETFVYEPNPKIVGSQKVPA